MKQNYFVVNGKKYYTGTIFIIDDMGEETEASFICYDAEESRCYYKINERICNVSYKTFRRIFIAVTHGINDKTHMPTVKKMKDSDINGLFIGWVWYIFLMAISVIFKDVIGLWILISIIFFSWRSKKIKEEGTYIEW